MKEIIDCTHFEYLVVGHLNSLISIRRKMICLIYEYTKVHCVKLDLFLSYDVCVSVRTVHRTSNIGHSKSNVLFLFGKIQVFDVVRKSGIYRCICTGLSSVAMS